MEQTINRIINFQTASRRIMSPATKLALMILCGLLLVNNSLAQEAQPEGSPMPEQSTPEATATPQLPDPNEALTPVPLANQSVDGDIVFTSPGQSTYPRDIRLSDNFGGLRFYGANSLTTSPAGAAIQFFGNSAAPFGGQLFLDSGALSTAALIFRTAGTGGTIKERMRVTSDGRVGIGTTDPQSATLRVLNNNTPIALQAQTDGTIGVFATSNTGTGVRGNSGGGAGVSGASVSGTGVEGSSQTGFAGRFFGNVSITGNLSKGSGSFKIDHPLDPQNKYLSHSFVESPDMMNIYNGNITTDARGRAVVMLPSYFTALNRDYRYQLTVVGRFAQAIIASEIKNNRFTIKTNKPGVKVSWQVTGVRQDAYAEAHRIPVEEEKRGEERGTYLHPEAFGQPQEKGITNAQHSAPAPQPKEKNRAARLQR